MSVTVLSQPQQRRLTSVETALEDLGRPSLAPSSVERLIDEATARVERICRRPLSRRTVTERFRGDYESVRRFVVAPIVRLVEVRLAGAVLDELSGTDPGVRVFDSELGTVWRNLRWTPTHPPDWELDYVGGYLVPDDDFDSTNVTVDGTNEQFQLSSGAWPAVEPGDWFRVAGKGSAANHGWHQVATRDSDTVLTVTSDLTTEASGPQFCFFFRNLPHDVERATLLMLKQFYHSIGRDPTVTREQIDDLVRVFKTPAPSSESMTGDLTLDQLLDPFIFRPPQLGHLAVQRA